MSAGGTAALRFHGFDALRACATLFGVAAHAGLMYSSATTSPVWPVKDAHPSVAANWLWDAAGLFLVPVFFLLAGFFAGCSVLKHGPRRFLRNRCLRLAVPFALGWAVGFPVLRAAAATTNAGDVPQELAPYPMHLWFLEYLLVYCVAGVLLAPRLGPLRAGFRRLLKCGLLPLAGAALTAPVLALAPANFGPPRSFVPDPATLVVNGAFFAVGWGLHANADRLVWLGRWGGSALLAGVLLAGLVSGGGPGTVPHAAVGPAPGTPLPEPAGPTAHERFDRLPHAVACAAIAWLLTFGLVGVFFRYLNREERVLRYVSGASFWLYLAHVPVLAWAGVLLQPFDVPGDAKLALAVLVCVCVLLVSHELLARLRARAAGARTFTPPAPGAQVRAAPTGAGGKEALA